jgi:hypothetical protein
MLISPAFHGGGSKKTPIQIIKAVGALLEKIKEAISFASIVSICIKCLWWDSNLEHCLAILIAFTLILPPSQIIRHSKNLGESKNLKFDQIYMIR